MASTRIPTAYTQNTTGPMSRATLSVTTRNADSGGLEFVASTEAIDQHRSMLLWDCWDLSVYHQNPVILEQHKWDGDLATALGVCDTISAERTGLKCKGRWGSHERGQLARQLYREKILRTFSVGFRIIKQVDRRSPKADIDALPQHARDALNDGRVDFVVTKALLLEVSCTLLPSNIEAQALAVRSVTQSTQSTPQQRGAGIFSAWTAYETACVLRHYRFTPAATQAILRAAGCSTEYRLKVSLYHEIQEMHGHVVAGEVRDPGILIDAAQAWLKIDAPSHQRIAPILSRGAAA